MRKARTMRLFLLLLTVLLPLAVHAEQAPGHIAEFPDIDLRWTRNSAVVAFVRNDIGRLDSAAQTVADHNSGMRRFLASWIRAKSDGAFAPALSDFQCEIFRRPISDRMALKIQYVSLCFLNNALILVNAQYADSVSANEITAELDRRYQQSVKGDYWFQSDKTAQDRLIEAYFQKSSNIVSYPNLRYYMSLKNDFTYVWQWDDGKKDQWDDRILFPRPQ